MSRPLRIEFPGAVYHVTSRGDRRESIFADDEDRESRVNRGVPWLLEGPKDPGGR